MTRVLDRQSAPRPPLASASFDPGITLDGFELVESHPRHFLAGDSHATVTLRAPKPSQPHHGLDIWVHKMLEKTVRDVMWTSPRGVQAAFRRAARRGSDFALARHLKNSELYALGVDTADALRDLGLRPVLIRNDPQAFVRRLRSSHFHRRRVALQLDAAHLDQTPQGQHPVAEFLRASQAKTYSINVGTPKAA